MTVKKIPLKENAAIRDFLTNRHSFIKPNQAITLK